MRNGQGVVTGPVFAGRVSIKFQNLSAVLVLGLLPLAFFLNSCTGAVKATSQTIAALFQLNPSSINFGTVVVGSKATQSVSVSNTGTVAVNITQATLSNPQFTLSGVTLPIPLGPGQSGSFSITVSPSTAGSITGTLTVAGDGGSSPVVTNLSATSVAASQPALTITPSTVSFGSVAVGAPATQTIKLSNSGTGTLSISQVTATGTGFSTASVALPISLSAGQSSTFNVQFAPTSTASASGSISVLSNAANSPTTIPLSGTGVAQTLKLSFSSMNLAFGNVTTGTSSTQNITLTNTGNSNVQISQIAESGTGFSLTGAATPLSLTPNQSFTFSVGFSPTTVATDNGTVTVTSNASGSPATITLSGSGVAPTSHTVTLTWTASTSTVSGYHVYRTTQSSLTGLTLLDSSLVTALSYVDSTVQSATTYYYVARAVDSSGNESANSNSATATIP